MWALPFFSSFAKRLACVVRKPACLNLWAWRRAPGVNPKETFNSE